MTKKKPTKVSPSDPANTYAGDFTWVDRLYDPNVPGYVGEPVQQDPQHPQRGLAAEAVKAVFPDGVPPASELPNKALAAKVQEYLKTHKPARSISDDTIKRAAGRK